MADIGFEAHDLKAEVAPSKIDNRENKDR